MTDFSQYSDEQLMAIAGGQSRSISDYSDDELKAIVGKARPDIGYTGAFATGLKQGVTANFSDELAGAKAASGLPGPLKQLNLMGLPTGAILGLGRMGYEALAGRGDATEAYEKARDAERETQKTAEEQYPGTTLTGNLAGAVALPVGGALNAATLPARMGRGAMVGAGYGAASGAGAGENLEDRAARTATGAGLGTVAGAAGPVVMRGAESAAQGVGKLAQPLVSAFRAARDPEAEAGRRVVTAIERDIRAGDAGLSPAEFRAAPGVVADFGGEMTRRLARSSSNTSPEGGLALRQVTDARFETQGGRTEDFLRGLVRTHANAGATREVLEKTAQTARKPFYDFAYKRGSGGIWDQELSELSQAPAVQAAVKAAITQAENRSASGRAGQLISQDGKPTLEFWDLVKKQLDQEINVAKRAGRKEDVMEINDLRSIIVGKLDAAVPSYAVARGVAAELFKANNALEAGEKFVTQRMNNAAVRKMLSRAGPEERELFAEGFVSKYIEKMNEVGDRRNILNSIGQSRAAKEQFDIVLGPQKTKELEAFLRVENVMDKLRTAVQGNSTTARQLMEAGLAGGAAGAFTGFDPTSMAGTAGMWLALRAGGKFAGQKIDGNVARRVGEMLASNDPAVLRRGLAIVSKSPQFMNSLRGADDFLAKIGGQQSANVPLLQAPSRALTEDER